LTPPEADPRAWVERARADLRVAELAAADPDLPDWPAGFHLQQAAEKALKALLIVHGRFPPRTHDLEHLCEAVAALDPSLDGWSDRLLPLADFGVAQRYPGVDEPALETGPLLACVRELVELAAAASRPTAPA